MPETTKGEPGISPKRTAATLADALTATREADRANKALGADIYRRAQLALRILRKVYPGQEFYTRDDLPESWAWIWEITTPGAQIVRVEPSRQAGTTRLWYTRIAGMPDLFGYSYLHHKHTAKTTLFGVEVPDRWLRYGDRQLAAEIRRVAWEVKNKAEQEKQKKLTQDAILKDLEREIEKARALAQTGTRVTFKVVPVTEETASA